ncbi:MAG: hypothetical protein IPJ41_11180 [Phycisphaerales bacterium]|nr:hypothetical protein [Phycisphaerales bacterium]
MIRRMIRTFASPDGARRARARLLAGLVGAPAGLRQSRRGSFLVMVVGTLALLAVVTIVYVSIGRADTQTSAAAVKVDQRDEVVDKMRDYISQIIADDTFDTLDLRERDERGNKQFRREAWDYPSLDYSVTVQLFNPTGDGTGTDPFLSSSEPSAINYTGTASYETTDPRRYFRDRVDWLQMSDVAPDGMPVNLWALRDDPKAKDDGFDATPWKMRADLSLLLESPEKGKRGYQTYFGATVTPPDGNTAHPADWFNGQQFAFFPKVDPIYGPNKPEYLLYQFADADGDGLVDSRWFEMVAARDLTAGYFERLLPIDNRLRYFWAVRAVDLSARVNVNTATDNTLVPDHEDPVGLTPSSVDLRRLLTLEDFYTDRRVAFGFEKFDQPTPGGGTDDYSGYDQTSSDGPLWYVAGDRGYDGLRLVLDTGELPPRAFEDGLVDLTTDGLVDRKFGAQYWKSWKGKGPFRQTDYYELFAGFGPGGGTGNVTSALGRAFVNDSLFELLTFNGVNNDQVRSPLESVLGGRGFATGRDPLLQFFSPLRDNRSTSLERDGRFTFAKGAASFDLDALAWSLVDPRQRLTTASGGRPLLASVLPADPNDSTKVDPAALPLGKDDLKKDVQDLFTAQGVPGQSLFAAYSDALLPYSGDALKWRWVSNPQYKTLFYGYRGPELALLTAAHMAANMQDAYDTDDRPTKRTVLLRGDPTFRKRDIDGPGGRDPKYPWKLLDLDNGLQNKSSRLADTNSDVSADAINVFGIEAQPFITEAASFIMYTDTPDSLGGDDDSKEAAINGIRVWRYTPSIDGRVPRLDQLETDNPDYLFDMLAFQVHNPFDESVSLSGDAASGDVTTARRGLYYIQFGSNYHKLTQVDFNAGGAESELTLGPGETKTFYVLSQNPDQIAKRIQKITGDTAYGGKTLDEEKLRIREWIDRQVGDDAVRLAKFDPASGRVSVPGPTMLFLQNGSESSRQVVRLWRVEKPASDTEEGGYLIRGVQEDIVNDQTNDTLVDRLRDPETGVSGSTIVSLDRRLPDSPNQQGKIGSAKNGPEPPDSDADTRDNKGLTITRYASIRRNEDPRANASSTVPRGGLPAYCVELKDQSKAAKNAEYEDKSDRSSLHISDFSGKQGDDTLTSLLAKQSGVGLTKLVPTISIDPDKKSGDAKNGVVASVIPNNLDNVPFEGDATHTPLYAEAHLDNNKFEDSNNNSYLRVADLLLPLGIGPYQAPGETDEDKEWTTLSECLALALYYEDPAAGDSVYAGAFKPDKVASDLPPLLDTGFVRYDAFVPFEDVNQNGQYDRLTEYSERWGLGVPMAATLFDAFTTIPRRYGSLTTPTFGQMNINTVSREAARSLPGLSPTVESGPDGSTLWWWTGGIQDWHSDIATTLVAYRDKQNIFTRDVDGTEATQGVNFRDWWSIAKGIRLAPAAKNSLPPGDKNDTAREGATGVEALRGDLGFRSLGELSLLRDWGYPSNPAYPLAHDIDRLGFDGKKVDKPGVDSVSYGTNHDQDDGISDDFDER